MSETEQVELLVARLDKIAEQNWDNFEYNIRINTQVARGQFTFECKERTDGHVALEGSGTTIAEAILAAEAGVLEALAEWGYDEGYDEEV